MIAVRREGGTTYLGRANTHDSLVVSEVFGPTFQGEGPNLGRRVAFVRLGACNLHCSWCDTAYTWDADRYDLHAELARRPVAEIAHQVKAMAPDRVVISGGEPLLWQDKPGWFKLLDHLERDRLPVEVETNGTLEPNEVTVGRVAVFNVSPKLAHGGDPYHARIKDKPLKAFAALAHRRQAVLKIVVQTPADVNEAGSLARFYGFPLEQVYVMPEGTTPEALVGRADLADAALAQHVNLTTRLHVLVWGEERGR